MKTHTGRICPSSGHVETGSTDSHGKRWKNIAISWLESDAVVVAIAAAGWFPVGFLAPKKAMPDNPIVPLRSPDGSTAAMVFRKQ
mmetsp:Transcript_13132/g.30820  ORF Transcript_13132/g.30820 Transcript_13132/m.30820 type:complete len:85 (+) Transcript_13132:948-1202(+)